MKFCKTYWHSIKRHRVFPQRHRQQLPHHHQWEEVNKDVRPAPTSSVHQGHHRREEVNKDVRPAPTVTSLRTTSAPSHLDWKHHNIQCLLGIGPLSATNAKRHYWKKETIEKSSAVSARMLKPKALQPMIHRPLKRSCMNKWHGSAKNLISRIRISRK